MHRYRNRVSRWVSVLASAASALAGSTFAGCSAAPVQSDRPFTTGSAGSAEAHSSAPAASRADAIRIQSIQRIANGDNDSLTAVVSIRNSGTDPRTVTIAVAWLSQAGPADKAAAVSRETVTLGPKESRDVTFKGTPGARDFKVNVTYPGS